MTYDRILIRYGEMSTKGRNRRQFVEKLKINIKEALRSFPEVKLEAGRDRMYIVLNGESIAGITEILQRIFGIHSFSPAMKVKKDLESIKTTASEGFRTLYKAGQTFKVSAKRADHSFPVHSDELNQMIGSHLQGVYPSLKVDMRNPDIHLHVEIRKEAAYLSVETFPGAEGLPVGSSGKAMLMLSGGIDSPVAGFLSMKRGIEIEAVHFFSPPYTSERAKQKVIALAKKLSGTAGSLILHIVPFTRIQEEIHKQIPENYALTATRRLMLRITDEWRKKRGGLAIITGESVGQVASQTLGSMYAINEVTNTPILRPLITMDKMDIITLAKEIDTYNVSVLPYEDCCTIFVSAAPKTKPKREKVNFYESFIHFDPFIQEALNGIETMQIKPGGEAFNNLFPGLF